MQFLKRTGVAAPFIAIAIAIVAWAQPPTSAPAPGTPPTADPAKPASQSPPAATRPGNTLDPETVKRLEALKNQGSRPTTSAPAPADHAEKPAAPPPTSAPATTGAPPAKPPAPAATFTPPPASAPAATTKPSATPPVSPPPTKPIMNQPSPPPPKVPATPPSTPPATTASTTTPPAAEHTAATEPIEEQASELRSKLLIGMLYAFLLSTCIGIGAIRRVSRLLHTPLMSLTNAISAIAVVGAIVVAGGEHYSTPIRLLGAIALFASTTNIISGFLITDRMLKMFKTQGGK